MRLQTGILSAVAVLAMAAPLAVRAADMDMSGAKVFKLHAQNGSHEYGTVALIPSGSSTKVVVAIVGAPDHAQPDHIHTGTCAKLDPTPKYPLTSVMGGVSETTVPVSISTLMASPMAVNVHESADDLKKYVACTDLAPAKE